MAVSCVGANHDTPQLLFSSKFLILSACVQQTLKNLCFDLRTKGTSSDFLPLVLSSVCIFFFSGSCFSIGCAALETPKPMCVVLGKPCSREVSPKSYCQELLGRQIILLREIRHGWFVCFFFFFFFCSAFVIQRCSCLASGLYVCMPLKAGRGMGVMEAYVEVCLVLCNLDRVTDIQG